MRNKPIYKQTGSSFIQDYFQLIDKNRIQLGTICIDTSREGQQFLGKMLLQRNCLPFFQKTQHGIMVQDGQPVPDSCIISMTVGQLKVGETPLWGPTTHSY